VFIKIANTQRPEPPNFQTRSCAFCDALRKRPSRLCSWFHGFIETKYIDLRQHDSDKMLSICHTYHIKLQRSTAYLRSDRLQLGDTDQTTINPTVIAIEMDAYHLFQPCQIWILFDQCCISNRNYTLIMAACMTIASK
jgi:hypothetical protein